MTPRTLPMVERALSAEPKTSRQIFNEIGRLGSINSVGRALNELVRDRRAVKGTIAVRRGGEASVFSIPKVH